MAARCGHAQRPGPQGLSKSTVTELAAALLAQLAAKDEHIAQRDREIKFKDAKIERITFELDGEVGIDNNHVERLMRPWVMGRKAWLSCGSKLADQRAAIVTS